MTSPSFRSPVSLPLENAGEIWCWPGVEESLEVFALHGWTGCGVDFEALVAAAGSERGNFFAFDLPGHGTCRDVVANSTLDVLRHLERQWDSLGRENGTSILLGYSMGGRMALQWTLEQPQRWAGLVLIGATPGIEVSPERELRQEQDRKRAELVEELGPAQFWAQWREKPLIASQLRMQEPWRSRLESRRLNNSGEGLASSLRGYGTGSMPSAWGRLLTLNVPVLLLTGAEDQKFDRLSSEMVPLLPNGKHVSIPGAGHAPHLERPEETWAVLTAWRETLTQGS